MTQRKIILKYLESVNNWVLGNKLSGLNTEWGFLSSRAERTARTMALMGEIDRKLGKQIAYYLLPDNVYYRAKQPTSYKDYWVEGRLVAREPIYA